MAGIRMYDTIDVVDNHPFRSSRVAIAVVASICLHALFFGILGQQLLLGISETSPTRSKKISLQILSSKRTETKPTEPEATVSAKPLDTERREINKKTSDQTSRENNNAVTRQSPSISSRQILNTAREAALQAAIRHPESTQKKPPTIESKLSKALNPKREPAGVSTLADGTTRVVTDWGHVYCIPPEDENGIPGPEDNMPLSKLCR
jgi:hypothetical protein